jgi:nucleoside 2-deoxyribosyltransferase
MVSRKAYLAIKYYDDLRNKSLIDEISVALGKAGIDTIVMVRDFEHWGQVKFNPKELMKIACKQIEEADVLVAEYSEASVGKSIEVGYAFAKNVPVIVIAKKGSNMPDPLPAPLTGIAKEIIIYNKVDDLTEKFKALHL